MHVFRRWEEAEVPRGHWENLGPSGWNVSLEKSSSRNETCGAERLSPSAGSMSKHTNAAELQLILNPSPLFAVDPHYNASLPTSH